MIVGNQKCRGWYDHKNPPVNQVKIKKKTKKKNWAPNMKNWIRKEPVTLPTEAQVKRFKKGKVLGNYLDAMKINQEEREARGFGNPTAGPACLPPTEF